MFKTLSCMSINFNIKHLNENALLGSKRDTNKIGLHSLCEFLNVVKHFYRFSDVGNQSVIEQLYLFIKFIFFLKSGVKRLVKCFV